MICFYSKNPALQGHFKKPSALTHPVGEYIFIYIDFTFGQFGPTYINTFGYSEFFLLSHHPKPYDNTGSLWKSLDWGTWGSYGYSVIVLISLILQTNAFFSHDLEPTDVILRMGLGWLEPHRIRWLQGIKGVKIIVLCWLIYGVSFNIFFNIDFRVSLTTQVFPEPINSDAQIDLFRDGIFLDEEYLGGSFADKCETHGRFLHLYLNYQIFKLISNIFICCRQLWKVIC